MTTKYIKKFTRKNKKPKPIKEKKVEKIPEKINYYQYLKSKEWKNIRRVILAKRLYKCELCGKKNKLEIHHLTYDILGKELEKKNQDYLMCLCDRCHEKTHNPKIQRLAKIDPKRNKEKEPRKTVLDKINPKNCTAEELISDIFNV